ncbi:MAG: hypothetical protein ABIF01_04945 [Candidatus Micrarchaeota archaeon]
MTGMLSLSTHCNPIRISIAGKETMTVTIKAKNLSDKPQLVSVDFEIPNDLSFDSTGVSNKRNAKVGEIAPGQSKEASFEVFATHRASQNEYKARVTGFAHYRNYESVLEKATLEATIRVLE